MAAVLQIGMISAAALPADGQTAPNTSAEAKPRSFGATGRPPVCPDTRVRLFFWPMRASSLHEGSVVNDVSAVGPPYLGGEEQRSPWGPGRFCIAASAAASPYMRSGPTGGPHHNASCTRRCPGERDPPETRRL